MTPEPREAAAVRVARALSDPTRFRLLREIAARTELSCRDLTARCDVSQATVSHHLKVLAGAGLVAARQEGPFHLYRAVRGALEAHARALVILAGGHSALRASRPPGPPARSGGASSGSAFARTRRAGGSR